VRVSRPRGTDRGPTRTRSSTQPGVVLEPRRGSTRGTTAETAKGDYAARELVGDDREVWRRAVEVWPAYVEYQTKTDRRIPVFALEPVAHPSLPSSH
jgi:F420H(2)-dependent quinone reductase